MGRPNKSIEMFYGIHFPTAITFVIEFNFPFIKFVLAVKYPIEGFILKALEVRFFCYLKCSEKY